MNDCLKLIDFKKYKSLDAHDGLFSIDMNSNLSLIIGRNNSGKSSVIDVIELACNSQSTKGVSNLSYHCQLADKNVRRGFCPHTTGGGIVGDHYEYGKKYIGSNIVVNNNGARFILSKNQENSNINSKLIRNWDNVAESFLHDLSGFYVCRVNADRDISPEDESDKETVDQNGVGATNLIRRFINYSKYDEKLIEQKLLLELNKIMWPDAHFSNIRIQQIDSIRDNNDQRKKWEIFLEENDDRYALSKCGSGLKTIILILLNLYVVPHLSECSGKKLIFAFEEVENNLHPALQRRFFEYLYDFSINENMRIFITTHSHVAINTYYGKDNVSIYHVTKMDGVSSLEKVDTDHRKLEILDDLGVKASDMFQANGIVWVEGPSDRIYIKHWLSIFCENDIAEGKDYQFAYYGGRLLAHYTGVEDDKSTENLINVLKLNRHAAIVIDSDKNKKNAHLNATKRRIRDEFTAANHFCWITSGKEIENYIPAACVNAVHSGNLMQIGQYEKFPTYIGQYDKFFADHKVDSARKYVEYISRENSSSILDLKDKIQKLYLEIKKWQ